MKTIGQVARQHSLTLRALRFYEDKGLIAPTREGTTRLYSDDDDARIGRIAAWARAGISLKSIKLALEYLDANNPDAMAVVIGISLGRIKRQLGRQMEAIAALQEAA